MLSPIKYHDYVLLIASFDADWAKRHRETSGNSKTGVEAAIEKIGSLCSTYRGNVENNLKKYVASSSSRETDEKEKLAVFLYNPLFFVPLGHADVLCFVLFDDFDPVQYLTAHIPTAVEDVTLAFCPKTDPGDSKAYPWLRNPDQLFARSPSNSLAPLITFTRLKMDAASTLGFALSCQHEIFSIILEKTKDALAELDKPHLLADNLYSTMDIADFELCILDLQGPEEIGILISCSNLTVAMSVIAAIESLHYSDIFRNTKLSAGFNESFLHINIVKLAGDQLYGSDVGPPSKFFDQRHAIRWANTSVGIDSQVFLNSKDFERCSGTVHAFGILQIAAGHHERVQQRVKLPDQYLQFQLGAGDLTVDYQDSSGYHRPLIAIAEAIIFIRDHFIRGDSLAFGDEDLLDWATQLAVPVPNIPLFRCNVREAHSSPFADLLPSIQRWLFEDDPETDSPNARGSMNLEELVAKPKQYGVPLDLRRSVVYLFHHFRTLLGDPSVFDSVADLYDMFATFHGIITKHLLEARRKEISGLDFIPTLDSGRLHQLTLIVEGLHNALSHRAVKAPPDSRVRDMAIDFRGGMNQIVMAAHVPVICGLGLFRKFVFPWNGSKTPRRSVGGITKVSASPGTSTTIMNLGVEHSAWLAVVEADVAHILHPAHYVDYIHECIHLILPCLDQINVEPRRFLPPTLRSGFPEKEALWLERIDEIFTELLTHMIVYGRDQDTFVVQRITSFGKSQRFKRGDDVELVDTVSEFVIRLFFSCQAIPDKDPNQWHSVGPWAGASLDEKGTEDRFSFWLDNLGTLLPKHETLWQNSDGLGRTRALKRLRVIYRGIAPCMQRLWNIAKIIFAQYWAAPGTKTEGFEFSQLSNKVGEAFASGCPIVRLYGPGYKAECEQDLHEMGVDALQLVSALFRQHAVEHLARLGDKPFRKSVYLSRSPLDSKVEYPVVKWGWDQFQIDRGAAVAFSPVPSARRRRVREEIVMLKTLWDISSTMRARRVFEMIEGINTAKLQTASHSAKQGSVKEEVDDKLAGVGPLNRDESKAAIDQIAKSDNVDSRIKD